MRKLQLLFITLFWSTCVFGQVEHYDVDSLINVLETEERTPLEQFELAREIINHYRQSDTDKYLEYAERRLSIAKKEKDKKIQDKMYDLAYEDLGVVHVYKGNYDTALIYFDKALEYAHKINDRGIYGIYMKKGSVYYQQNKLSATLECLQKALSLCEKADDKATEIHILINIGNVFNQLGDYDRSDIYLEKARIIMEEHNVTNAKVDVYLNLVSMHKRKKEYQKALDYCMQIEELCRVANNKRYAIYNNINFSLLYVELEEYDKANNYAEEALKLAIEFGDPIGIRESCAFLAESYLNSKKYKEADAYAQMSWDADSTDISKAFGIACILTASNMYLDNKEKAFIFLKKISELNNQLNKKDYHANLMEMEIKYETEKKELRITSLEQEKQLYTGLGVLSMIVIILGGLLFFYRNRLNKQKITQLKQEKQLVATQALLDGETAERSRLARDLHDGLGGLLSVLKLNLNEMKKTSLTKEDEDYLEKALEVLEESNKELRRIAHHMMPESLMRTGLETSLSDFCKAIPGVTFQYIGQDIRLDERLEITLYRCAYELINNAVKYSDATNIDVQLLVDDNLISLSVYDNGIGFDPASVTTGSGLDNIRTRIATFNGKMHLKSSPEHGTEIIIEIERT